MAEPLAFAADRGINRNRASRDPNLPNDWQLVGGPDTWFAEILPRIEQ